MTFKNPFPDIHPELHCFDFSKGVETTEEYKESRVRSCYHEAKANLDKQGFGLASCSTGDTFIQCRINNFTDIQIIIACSKGYKRLDYYQV